MHQLFRNLGDGTATTIPLADDFPYHAGRDSTPEDGVELGVTCRDGFIGIGQEGLEWTGRLGAFPADEGDDLVCFVRGDFARARYVAGSGEKDVGYVLETT